MIRIVKLFGWSLSLSVPPNGITVYRSMYLLVFGSHGCALDPLVVCYLALDFSPCIYMCIYIYGV